MADNQASTTNNIHTPMTACSVTPPPESSPPPAGSNNAALGVVPEGKVAVWDDTMKQVVIKDKEDVKLQTWGSRVRNALYRFWAGGPIT